MIKSLRHIGVIANISMLEGARKQVFHVLMLFALTLLACAILLGRFGRDVQIQTIKDMCSAVIMVSSALIALTLSVTGIPQEVEQKTLYPVLAKPVARWEFVVGKYAGVMGTVAIGIAVLALAFCSVLVAYTHALDPYLLTVIPFIFLETALVASIGTLLSTVASPALAWFAGVFVYILGSSKFGIYAFLLGGREQTVASRFFGSVVYHLLPNLECFNFKESLVHHLPVPEGYLIQTAVYAILYTAAVLTAASYSFGRREL